MASITISGVLTLPTTGLAAGDKIRFTHQSTTGETLFGSVSSDFTIPIDGTYLFELQYGLIRIDTWTFRDSKWTNQGVVTVNDDQTATTLPELLNSTIPPTPLTGIHYPAGSTANPEYPNPTELFFLRGASGGVDVEWIDLASSGAPTLASLVTYDDKGNDVNNELTFLNAAIAAISGGATGVVADMVASTTLVVGDTFISTGYTTAGDGGDNTYEIVAAGTGTADGGEYIDLPDTTPATQAKGLFPKQLRSVRQWGAVTGAAGNDTVAVLAAVAAMTSHSALYFPAAIYVVNETMDFTGLNKITVYGDGWGATIIQTKNGTFGDKMVFSRDDPTADIVFGITIRDLQLYTEGVADGGAEVTAGGAIHIVNGQRIIVENVFIRNCYKGIWLEGIRDGRFDNFEIVSSSATTHAGSCHLHVADNTQLPFASRVNTETFFTNFNFTTGGNAGTGPDTGDLQYSVLIDGNMDGIWFSDGHTFGGDTANWYLNAANVEKFGGLRLENVFIDQFCTRNIVFTGTATTYFRNFTFSNCRIFGGDLSCILVNSSANMVDTVLTDCEIGTAPGQGVQMAGGEMSFLGCTFRFINSTGALDPAYAIQTTTNVTRLTVIGCDFELSKLDYGIFILANGAEYRLQGNVFYGQDGGIISEISFSGSALIGACSGNTIGRPAASLITATTTLSPGNIANDQWSLEGSTVNVNTFQPHWHGRKITIRAAGSTQNIISGTGNILNRQGTTPFVLDNNDVVTFEYSENTSNWHRV